MTTRTFILFISIFFVSNLFTACNDDDSNDNNCEDTGNFPYVAVGNKWTYDLEELFSDATTLEVEITDEVNSGVFEFSLNTTSPSFPTQGFYVPCGNTIYALENENDELENKTHRISNSAVGTTWSSSSNGQVGNFEVIEQNVSVVTPAGNFLCDKITVNVVGTFNTDTIYDANQFGTIKYDGFLFSYELREKNF